MNKQDLKDIVLWFVFVAIFVSIAIAASAALADGELCHKEYRKCMDAKFKQPYTVNFKSCKKNLEKCVRGSR
jgi:hypothetical protein